MTWETNWQFRIRTLDAPSSSGHNVTTGPSSAALTALDKSLWPNNCRRHFVYRLTRLHRSKSRTLGSVASALLLVSPAEIDLCTRHSSKSTVAWLCCSGSVSQSKLTYWSGVFHSTCHVPAGTEHQSRLESGCEFESNWRRCFSASTWFIYLVWLLIGAPAAWILLNVLLYGSVLSSSEL